ncbi:MAG: hypothetical protein AAF527_07650 [Pseudomonadota bacterium]
MGETGASYERGTMDTEAQSSTYGSVMRFTGFVGIPLALSLTAFFTALVVRLGFFPALAIGVIAFALLRICFKYFFK